MLVATRWSHHAGKRHLGARPAVLAPNRTPQVLSIDATPHSRGGRRCIYNESLLLGFGFWLR